MSKTVKHPGWSSGIRLRALSGALALAIALVPAAVTAHPAQETNEAQANAAPTYTILYAFTGTPDGAQPNGGLVRDAAGNLYGTTFYGGAGGIGAVFKLDTTGKETVLYSFTGGPGGNYPNGGLVLDAAGNLYGTTSEGGQVPFGFGVVFKLDTTGNETVLHTFTGGTDGGYPFAGLVRDAAGNLYGTAPSGGNPACEDGCGVVYKVDTTGQETVLYSFTGEPDGLAPFSALIRDALGNLYGTTVGGGAFGRGIVFKLDTAGKETVLHSFAGYPSDGEGGGFTIGGPSLVRDSLGNFYGATSSGGAFRHGVVFELNTAGKETVLHNFTGGLDGGNPTPGLVRDSSGNLYGTAFAGGAGDCGGGGCGVAFKLDKTGKVTVLHSFALTPVFGPPYPNGNLIRDSAGNLYGTTVDENGFGTVFKLMP
jgi:uncharacterized repeat protein (TIGR03803 family)